MEKTTHFSPPSLPVSEAGASQSPWRIGICPSRCASHLWRSTRERGRSSSGSSQDALRLVRQPLQMGLHAFQGLGSRIPLERVGRQPVGRERLDSVSLPPTETPGGFSSSSSKRLAPTSRSSKWGHLCGLSGESWHTNRS